MALRLGSMARPGAITLLGRYSVPVPATATAPADVPEPMAEPSQEDEGEGDEGFAGELEGMA